MSVTGGAIGVALLLIAEEVVLGNKRGPSAVSGIFGTVSGAVAAIASPDVPGIPNLTVKKAPTKG